jgi:aminoglycoside phosphotransferase (APT) family kinase protein/putative sterol carrier protein
MLARERDLNDLHRRLSRWLRGKYATADEVRLTAFKKPSAGVSNETLMFSVTLREQGQEREERLVARLMPVGSPVFPEYDLVKQFRILECLRQSGVPAPQALWFEGDEDIIGSPFYVMRAVEGVIPSEIPPYHAFGFCLEISPAQRQRLWWSGIETLARIHGLDWRRLGLSFLGVPPEGTGAVDRQLEYYKRFLDWARGERPQPILEAALDWLNRNRYAPRRVALCWGDSRLPNMIFRDQEVAAVLDWEMAFLGDPEADLAWWLFLDWCHSTGYGIPRLEGLSSEEETVARYEKLSGHPVEQLPYQKVMAAFRYGVITLRVARLMLEAKLPIANEDMETNNVCTQWLARQLDLPPPGAGRAVTHLDQVTARVQFHLTGAGGSSWYIVAASGKGSRHEGTVENPDVTLTADAADWHAIQSGELNRTQAFLGGKLKIEGDVTLLLQLEDVISKLPH